jgi:glycosyltransferase involved in cell wall biosynthesis
MNKRILMVSWEYPPRITGGLGVATKGLASALTKMGNTVNILLPKLTGNEEEIPGINLMDFRKNKGLLSDRELSDLANRFLRFYSGFNPASVYGSGGEHPEDLKKRIKNAVRDLLHRTNFKLGQLEDLLTGNYSNRIYQEISLYADWVALLSTKMDYDIIHAHDWMTYKAAIGAHRLSGKPFICHVHSTEFDRSGERVNQYIYDLEREAFHTATMNITVSEYTRRILLDRYGVPAEKVRTVHNGVEFNLGEIEQASVKGKRKVAPKGKVVTFVGRITFQKGPDYFVRAAKTVIEWVWALISITQGFLTRTVSANCTASATFT